MSEWSENIGTIYAMMLNDWCCEQMGARKWEAEPIKKMLEESNSDEEFKEKFTRWLIETPGVVEEKIS